MAQVGADPDDLRALARTLRSAAGQLDDLSIGLARRTRSAGWRGPDADAFESSWQSRHRPALHASSSGLSDLARRAERQAAEQVRASSASGSLSAIPLLERRTAPVTLPEPRPAPRNLAGLHAWPRAEQRFAGTVELRVGPVTSAFVGGLTIAELTGGRRRVVLAETLAVGAGAGAGSSVEVGIGGPTAAGAPVSGTSADVGARAGLVHRRSWEVDEADLDGLLARLAVERAGGATTATGDPLVRLGAAVDGVVERLTGDDPGWDGVAQLATGVPTPRSTESLTEVQLAGSVGVGLGSLAGLGGRLHGVTWFASGAPSTAAVRGPLPALVGAGGAELRRRRAVEHAAAAPRGGAANDVHGDVTVRLEVPDPVADGLPPHVLVRVGSGNGATTDDVAGG